MGFILIGLTAAIGIGVFLYFRHLGDDALRAEDEKEEMRLRDGCVVSATKIHNLETLSHYPLPPAGNSDSERA
jgi:hypothetical protein